MPRFGEHLVDIGRTVSDTDLRCPRDRIGGAPRFRKVVDPTVAFLLLDRRGSSPLPLPGLGHTRLILTRPHRSQRGAIHGEILNKMAESTSP
jgi:hypothetical protein